MAYEIYAGGNNSFSPTNFRNSFNGGIGRPSLFLFRLKRYPNVYFSKTSDGLGNLLGGLGIGKDITNVGETLYENLTGSGLSDLQFRINRVGLPDKQLRTYTTKIYGPGTEFPREIENGSLTFNVLSGGNYYEHDFFQSWADAILGYNTQKNSAATDLVGKLVSFIGLGSNSSTNNPNFNVAYYDDIVTDAEMVIFNEEANPTYLVSFEEVYPMVVGGIEFDWNLKNEISNFNVVLNYRFMKTQKIAASIGGTTGALINLASAIL